MNAFALFLRIFKHEWRMLFSDRTPWLVCFLLAAAASYGVVNGIRWVAFQQTTIRRAVTEETLRYRALKQQVTDIESGTIPAPFADPRAPDMVGGRLAWTYAAMPPLSLAPLSIGQSDVLPYYFNVSTASKESVMTANEIENPHRLLQGRFDLSFVVVYLVPLLIIALGYNLMSSEKEQGTLALLLSQPLSLGVVMAGKVGVRAVLVVVLGIVLSLGAMAVGGVDVTSNATLVRLIIWTGLVLAYGAFWFAAVLFVVSFGWNSAANALALAGLWLVWVVILPSALNLAVSVLYPMPSRVDMIAALRVASDEASGKGTQLLAKYYGNHPELVAGSDMEQALHDVAMTRLAIDDEVEQKVRPVVDRYDTQLSRQQSVVDRVRLLSPAIVAQDALNDIAGTGAPRYRHFVSLVEDYHRVWRELFASMIVRKQRFTPPMYDLLPQFVYREEPLQALIARTGTALAILIGAAILLGGFGARRLKRYPVTG